MEKQSLSSLIAMVIGDTYLDLVSEQRETPASRSDTFFKTLGGNGFLTAVALSRLQVKTTLTSLLSKDAFGINIQEALEEEGVFINQISSNKTPLRLSSQDGSESLIYENNHALLPPLDAPLHSMFIFFSKFLLRNNLLEPAKAEILELKKNKKQVVMVIEEAIDEKALLDLTSLANLTISFGGSELDFALIENTSSVIERQPGVFEAVHHGEKGCFTINAIPQIPEDFGYKTAAKIPSFVASYSLNWFLQKSLSETAEFVSNAVSLSGKRAIPSESLPFKKEIDLIKTADDVEIMHTTLLEKDFECLCFLTFDQTSHFEELARTLKKSSNEISAFKELIYKAFLRTLETEHTATLGMCVDNFHGSEILIKSLSHPFLLMRTVDDATKNEFLDNPYALIRSFPRKEIVKARFHLKDGEIPFEDMLFLKRIYEAAKATGHRFLIEIYDKEVPGRDVRVLQAVKKIYKQGIHPDLWKLQPAFDLKGWDHFEEVIDQFDKTVGILILADKLCIKDLAKELKTLREKTHKIKGFAIGRSLWQTVAEHWFEERISDEMVVCEVAFNFKRLLRIWENPSEYHEEEFEEKDLQHLKR